MSDGAALFKAEHKRAVAHYTLLQFNTKVITVLSQRDFVARNGFLFLKTPE